MAGECRLAVPVPALLPRAPLNHDFDVSYQPCLSCNPPHMQLSPLLLYSPLFPTCTLSIYVIRGLNLPRLDFLLCNNKIYLCRMQRLSQELHLHLPRLQLQLQLVVGNASSCSKKQVQQQTPHVAANQEADQVGSASCWD